MSNKFCKGSIKLRENISVLSGPMGLNVEINNNSDQEWSSGSTSSPVFICYHWLDENWQMMVFEGMRTHFPSGRVAPGKSVVAAAEVDPPPRPGRYKLMLTLVREGMYWFDESENFRVALVSLRFEPDTMRSGRWEGMINNGLDKSGSYVRSKAYDKNRRLGFMHIPKTAGSAMRVFLKKVTHPRSNTEMNDRSVYSGMPGVTTPVLPQVDCYLGHTALETLINYCPDGQYITVFREASCRILSHWLFWASFPDEWLASDNVWRDKHKKSLVETLSDPEIACQFDNLSLRILLWPHEAIPDLDFIDKKDDEELLHLAMNRLRKFSFLDVIENPQFTHNIAQWVGSDIRYERVNVTSAIANESRIDLRREFTAGAMEALEDRSRLDRVLWTTVAAARLPGVDLGRLTRDTVMMNLVRYSSLTSRSNGNS